MFIKKAVLLLIIAVSISQASFADQTIAARNNAYMHNNKGLVYLDQNYYFGAIKEFQMAIDLNPDSQASATFYINLGVTYDKLGYYELAKPCFEKALSLNALCFDYYLRVADNYKKLGIVEQKLIEFDNNKKSPLNEIMVGLLLVKKGKVNVAIMVLDDFCNKEPKLIITPSVLKYLSTLTGEPVKRKKKPFVGAMIITRH